LPLDKIQFWKTAVTIGVVTAVVRLVVNDHPSAEVMTKSGGRWMTSKLMSTATTTVVVVVAMCRQLLS
jgi:hypothetical protein